MFMESVERLQMFDEWLAKKVGKVSEERVECEHHLVRAMLIPEVVRLISERFGISEETALERFYKSATAENLADEENGLYGQSALFIFGQYLEECECRGEKKLEGEVVVVLVEVLSRSRRWEPETRN